MLQSLLDTLAEPGQPTPLFDALAEHTRQITGHQLFTLLYVDGSEVARIYSSQPEAYPVSGRKHMGPTDWGNHVLRDKQPLLLPDKAAIKWAFFDHELIYSLGLGACINIPCLYDGKVVGTMNMLAPEGQLTEDHLNAVKRLAGLPVAGFLAARFENNAK
ncbi:hypothetical protein BVG79_p1000214 (plasmid) [Ketogulonicigenium robustum]|uniref:GAF domain-containing protein n=1 Tax=Ketogulonicigenium robustum TaxID=92947 RepID=A0A1W6P3H0_9RHOB|nr:GAF domain-containing protein [Ketogulonicigenium robustum]ARO16016.1 hypothetical protein BVG79_p1000214 [Ketogulonicigenium robustum]